MTYPVTEVIKKINVTRYNELLLTRNLILKTASLIAEEFGIAVEELPPEVDLNGNSRNRR